MGKNFFSIMILLLFFYSSLISQQNGDSLKFSYHRDFKVLLSRTQDKTDPFYYDTLLQRFLNDDSSLTSYEVLVLQIGFTAKEEYKPYKNLETERELYRLNSDGKINEALELCKSFIKTHPLSFSANRELSYCYHKLGNKKLKEKYWKRFQKIADSMVLPGKGTDINNSLFALGPADGQTLIRSLWFKEIGTMGSGRDENGYFHDILEMKFEDSDKSVTLYFNIDHAMKNSEFSKQILELVK